MIFIDRNRRNEKGDAICPSKEWIENANNARELAIRGKKEHIFKDHIYSSEKEVRTKLYELFHQKCAYTEMPLQPTDWDVDHFRPKGRVQENHDHPGYYWLAYSWWNLYPAVKSANESRKNAPIFEDMTDGVTLGKADQFPLSNETTRARKPSDKIENEKHYLLDPCKDNPEIYLGFNPKGEVFAKKGNLRGQKTIEICGLNQRRLCKTRRTRIKRIKAAYSACLKLRELGETACAQELHDACCSDSADFAALARAVFNDPEPFF